MLNFNQLRFALAHYLGQTLTPEAAAHVFSMATADIDAPIDLSQFAPLAVNDYTVQTERFADILGELHPMHERHWLETEKHRHGLLLNPDYPSLLLRERQGMLLQFTVRRGAELAGNLRMYLGTSVHTRTMLAEEDTLYIAPEHRGGLLLVLSLMRYAERCLRTLGVREIAVNSKLLNRADVLMRRLGYTAVALQFVKTFPALNAEQEKAHVRPNP